jgi:hypothetical protein
MGPFEAEVAGLERLGARERLLKEMAGWMANRAGDFDNTTRGERKQLEEFVRRYEALEEGD